MTINKDQCWLLVLTTPLIFCGGCLSTGSKVAERGDPFLEQATMAAQPAATNTESVSDSIRLINFTEEKSARQLDSPSSLQLVAAEEMIAPTQPLSLAHEEIVPAPIEPGIYPIDLANALGLGGADNLQVRLARTRLFQAQARHLEAKTLWLPSLRLGVGYNKHDGRLQETAGNVIEVERNSLFYGAGFGLGNTPLTGGAGGPPRLFVNLSLADAYFKPLAACQEVAAHGAAERVASNESLAEIAIGYHSLLEAQGRLANANDAQTMASKMVELVEEFEREGFSSQAEVSRARAAHGRWQREVAEAERHVMITSARLARVLRLPPQIQLMPVEEFLMPIDFVDGTQDLDTMIATAWQRRPEISQQVARREAACFRVQEEKWRPWIPNVHAGASGGGFGGGTSTNFPSSSDRSDVDLLAVWEWQNMGLGNVARQRIRRGQLHERVLELESLRDQIAAEVVATAADVAAYRKQMGIAQQAIQDAQQSYELNEQRIRANEGLPIEMLQSISALAEARNAYTEAVANYNRAQYRLLRAVGNPAGVPVGSLSRS